MLASVVEPMQNPDGSLDVPEVRTIIDDLAETLVVPSFTRIGYDLRRRLFRWQSLGDLSMHGRAAAVTGATSGLGEVTATALARMGSRVLFDRARPREGRDDTAPHRRRHRQRGPGGIHRRPE